MKCQLFQNIADYSENAAGAVPNSGGVAAKSSGNLTWGNVPWHLQAGYLDAVDVWPDYTGKGISIGVFDDGVQAYGTQVASAISSSSVQSTGFLGIHGTAVSGLIAARPGADQTVTPDPIGVAYGATLTVADCINGNVALAASVEATAQNYDVINDSWGWAQLFYANRASPTFKSFFSNLEAAAELGRDGLGTSQVVASGNSRASGGDANFSNFTNDRHVITVAATTSEHLVASYSNGGASVLVAASSSGGAEGLTTTDVAGAGGYSSGSVTTSFGGTSGAAPQVTGVVALMLEANSNLGWRDVHDILAYSARQISATTTVVNGAHDWNGGGLLFSNDTGFGEVDARAAVRLAETWTATSTSANEQHLQATSQKTQYLTDNSSIEYKVTLASGLDLENVQLSIAGQHSRVSDLRIELISPTGTVATLLSHEGNGMTGLSNWTFGANTFLGEDSGGTWTVRISDTVFRGTGTFSGITLDAYGSKATADTTYVFTDAYGDLGTGSRSQILDTAGHDAINAAAVSTNLILDLHAGATSWIAGRSMVLGPHALMTTAFGGDGNDTIIGNDLGNYLWGGRGNDVIRGGAGDDILVGGTGNDMLDGGGGFNTAVLNGSRADWSFSSNGNGQIIAANATVHEQDLLLSVQRINFDDGAYDVSLMGQLVGLTSHWTGGAVA